MKKAFLAVSAFALGALLCVSGCSSEGGTDPGTGNKTGAGGAGNGNSGTTPAAAAYSPSCEKYYGSGGCCEKLLKATMAPADTCTKAKQAIDDGLKQGAKSADYETACKGALDAASSAGYCK